MQNPTFKTTNNLIDVIRFMRRVKKTSYDEINELMNAIEQQVIRDQDTICDNESLRIYIENKYGIDYFRHMMCEVTTIVWK